MPGRAAWAISEARHAHGRPICPSTRAHRVHGLACMSHSRRRGPGCAARALSEARREHGRPVCLSSRAHRVHGLAYMSLSRRAPAAWPAGARRPTRLGGPVTVCTAVPASVSGRVAVGPVTVCTAVPSAALWASAGPVTVCTAVPSAPHLGQGAHPGQGGGLAAARPSAAAGGRVAHSGADRPSARASEYRQGGSGQRCAAVGRPPSAPIGRARATPMATRAARRYSQFMAPRAARAAQERSHVPR